MATLHPQSKWMMISGKSCLHYIVRCAAQTERQKEKERFILQNCKKKLWNVFWFYFLYTHFSPAHVYYVTSNFRRGERKRETTCFPISKTYEHHKRATERVMTFSTPKKNKNGRRRHFLHLNMAPSEHTHVFGGIIFWDQFLSRRLFSLYIGR